MNTAHQINIIVHVIFGIIALLLGLAIMVMRKGNSLHVKTGGWYIKVLVVVVITGLLGILIFKRNVFLLVVTILSGYTAWSGVRTLRLKGEKPTAVDILVPLITIITATGYLYYLKVSGGFWSPVVTWSILGALFLVCGYDLLRLVFSLRVRRSVWLYEHIYKMVSSFVALTSAFTGTVLGNYKPYSQIVPGILGWLYIVGAIIYFASRQERKLPNTF